MNTKISNKSRTIFLVISICLISIITSLLIAIDASRPQYYAYLPLLPLSFGLISLMFFRLYRQWSNNLAVCFIMGGYFIRNVIGPLTLKFGNYKSMFFMNSEGNVNLSIALMIYEVLFVYTVLLLYMNTRGKHFEIKRPKDLKIENRISSRTFKFIFWIIIGYLVFVVLYIPEIKSLYTTVFSNEGNIVEVSYDYDSIVQRGGIKRPLMTLFVIAVGFMRYFVPTYFMVKIRNKVGERTVGLVYSIPFILLNLLVVSATNAESIFGIVVSAIILSILYPTKRSIIFNFFALIGIAAFIYIMILKIDAFSNWTGSKGFESISEAIQAYFPGLANIAAAFNVVNPNKLKTLFFDIYSSIPFRGSFFSLEDLRLVIIYNQQNSVSGQIIPFISQSQHYLGSLFAPILPAIFACLAIKINNKIKIENDIWKIVSFSFLLLLLSITPIMYNLTIFLSQFFNIFIPLIIISKFSRKLKI